MDTTQEPAHRLRSLGRGLARYGAGLVGAGALTLADQSLRRVTKHAPRMDRLGMRTIARLVGRTRDLVVARARLRRQALVMDLASNSLFYGLLVRSRRPILGGLVGGAIAGASAVVLPPLIGLEPPLARDTTLDRRLLTVGEYALGGALAGVAARLLGGALGAK